MLLPTAVKMLVLVAAARGSLTARVARRAGDERGELGSWMILAAGLAVAAAAAVAVLGPWFSSKATNITRN